MADYGKGFIVSKSELHNGEYGMNTSHWNGNVTSFLNPTTHKGQLTDKENAIHIMMGLGTFYPGGGIEEHYHVYADDVPIFDHAYYVISGRIRATMGDSERIVGADSLIYCPSNVRHSITNVGKGTAKILRIKGSGEGEKTGKVVYTKEQGRVDYWVPAIPK